MIGTNANWAKALDLQNSQIDGSAEVGPYELGAPDLDEAISLGPNGVITEGTRRLSEERRMPIYVPEGVQSLAAMGPLAVAGVETTIPGNGYYSSITVAGIPQEDGSMIEGKLIIDADFLLAIDSLRIMGGGSIVINPGVHVTLYITQELRSMGGGIVNDSKVSSQLRIYGGADCDQIEIGGTPDFYGVVYAPNANIDCNGTGNIYGSLVGDTVRVVGTPIIYYDVALKDDSSLPVLTVLRDWEEIS